MIDLSIVIVNWNTKNYLQKCLSSIYGNIKNITFEIIVVDNASSDSSVEMVRSEFPSAILIENKSNLGYGAANNKGIVVSKGKYILILNPDTIIFPNSIQNLIAFLDGNPRAGAVGPKILNPDDSIQFECARNFPTPVTEFYALSTMYKRFSKSKIFGKYLMSYWDHNDQREVDLLSGACMLVRRKVFDEVGLFDEDFFMYTEETDFFYRIKQKEWKVYFLPSAKIEHLWGKSTEQLPYSMAVEARKTMELFFKKHYGLRAVFAHRVAVIFASFFMQVFSLFMYLLAKGEERLKAKNIFLKNNFMLRWALGFK